MRYLDCCVPIWGHLWNAMKAIDQSGAGIALIVDREGRLLGTLSDGDIRRALLGGAQVRQKLEPFVHRDFTAVTPHTARAEVLDLMQARRIGQVPVLDKNGRLIGLHLMEEMLGPAERPNWAVIMAGGKGTRLRPLTEGVPKPMLRVAGRPILERLVLHLVGHGIRRVFLSVGYLAEVIEEHFGDGSRFGCRIEYLREDVPLGTGGALSLLPEKPTCPLLVLNGDLVTSANVGAMLDAHEGLVTIGVRPYVYEIPFGCLEVEGRRVLSLSEKPQLSRLVNAGIYVLSPEVLARVPAGVEFPLTRLISESLPDVTAFEIADEWTDVGAHEQLQAARGVA